MGFSSKKKVAPKKMEKKEAPVQKSPTKVIQPPKQGPIEQTLHDRVLTAEGWRRRVNAKAKKSAK